MQYPLSPMLILKSAKQVLVTIDHGKLQYNKERRISCCKCRLLCKATNTRAPLKSSHVSRHPLCCRCNATILLIFLFQAVIRGYAQAIRWTVQPYKANSYACHSTGFVLTATIKATLILAGALAANVPLCYVGLRAIAQHFLSHHGILAWKKGWIRARYSCLVYVCRPHGCQTAIATLEGV